MDFEDGQLAVAEKLAGVVG